ncbi:tRNA (adenosine(37)-N6)-threonylcarbamoyltransferase complex dimerization subunit type 1 TsaB [Microbulbifer sp. A4B17]|uniref:tRNA (adenosine(37)-N6)-threonylcarbamoyltransferase complex dimerization subunit type 1 TsaB n=1 Tax=Microbulbifer sp. A4B17 TaxID=359370 RepID=UPI000D52C3E7|nr:tRNA (adenosine(37)-N6)-threonylcarbamoyltransferase complex dimerization subunit type 1 TsaB [Microbulbifer sp. A4B17]AWF82101.1 tRNA (adenosine(37)-N6)-threonylcarbamoyltransferase complex dimerization subunit type 1 TsaB [Microbulbifer sp. A4B17]
MKILALDTTSGACSVALISDDQLIERFVQAERDHTRRLLPMVDEVLAEADMKLADLDALAVSQGPGSFTGLRIAISSVQGLAYASDLPVVPVSSLAALALGARRSHPEWGQYPIVAMLDARMQQVYWGVYSTNSPSESLIPEAVQNPEEVLLSLEDSEVSAPIYGAGPGLHYDVFRQASLEAVDQACFIYARDIAQLAVPLLEQGNSVTAEELEPVYLRNEVTWKKRQKIRSQ